MNLLVLIGLATLLGGESLLAYLLYRKRFPLTRISPEKQACSLRLKKLACVGIAFMAVGACVTVIGLSIL